nr:DUF4270 family protein [uncultured Bacteroides sp.]
MRKILYSLLAGLLACYACQDNNSSLGSSLVESSFYNVFTNSCTVDLSTILLDSIETREDTIGHFGHYADTLWGEVTATYYAEFTKNTFSTTDGHDYQFDSLVLSMTPSGHYWGDTLTPQYISVYRLKQPIVLDNDEDLYNTTVMATEDVPLTRFSYLPQPGRQREVEVRLPDAMGRQLLTDILVEDTYLDTQESFKKVFPGLALVAETSGSCITGFLVNDSSMTLNLHYRDISNQTTESELIFSVNTEYAYTGVRHNPTGTALDNLQSGIENLIHASSMGYRAYLQGLTGYYNQIEFPDLNELQSKGEIVSVESATLYLYPLARSYNEVSQLPEEVRIYITDENNVLEDYVYGSDGVTVQTGNLTIDEMYGRETYYSFDLTEFIRNNFGTSGTRRQKLLMSLTDEEMATTFNQVVFTALPGQDRQCRLDVRLKIYNEQ